jgi:hypothetical protein
MPLDLKSVNFVKVSYDISNHKHVKQHPFLVCYFQAYDIENLLKNKLLTFEEISGQTADIIFMQAMKEFANYDFQTKVYDYQPIIPIQNSKACSEVVKEMC